MEQTNTQQKPQGKGMAVAGFIISLVGLVIYFPIAIVVTAAAVLGGGYGLGIFWLLFCVAGTLLCIMGMMKLGKTGGKKGLAIAGMVIGIVAVILSVLLVMGISKAQQMGGDMGDKFKDAMEKGMNHSLDSLTKAAEKALDTTNMH